MSPLTKIFVGLLVVFSLLLTAATVTFVSTLDNQRELAQRAKTEADNQKARAEAEAQAATAKETEALNSAKLAQASLEELKKQTNASQQLIAERDVRLADLGVQIKVQAAEVTRLSEALKAFQDSNSRMQEMVASLRQSNDQAIQQTADYSRQNSDLTNKLEVTERERKFATEQLEEIRNQNQKLGAAIRDMGRNPGEILASATVGVRGGAPRINGVVREVRMIAGLPYATISVGAAADVTKGMEFNIVDRNTGNFLGKLTVDTVELTESTGRITGPNDKLAQIKPGVEVKTQL